MEASTSQDAGFTGGLPTLYESHFAWQIRSFWWGLAWAVVGTITAIIGIGFLILGALVIWLIYRMVKGLLFWNDHKPMPL
ncbi:hypothetical protein J1777_12330 [Comamonas denitrificans]|uniref:Uncharacterized protein n=1 Tax=Comamonas denitrificans TaxID=117506 RepID=A0A939KB72_9BURK|nr:hypothetical protein [Comamonas denitrificans]MBO1250605.1 hypothetical protein [Comamonas denitrificans]